MATPTAYSTIGIVLAVSNEASPEVWSTIGQVVDVNGVGSGAASEIDVTDLSHSVKEYLMGVKDSSEITLSLTFDPANTQHTALRTSYNNSTKKKYRITLPDDGDTTITFYAFVKTFATPFPSNSKLAADVSMRVSGLETWA